MSDYDNNSLHSHNDQMPIPDYDNYSIASDSTSGNSFEKNPIKRSRRNAGIDNTKSNDTGYHKVIKRQSGMKLKIEIYSTSFIPGTMIRDAITGHRHYQYRVGSWHEDLFFKVKEVTGQVGKEAYTLFYDSPEQFERHMNTTISIEDKKKWTDKFAIAQSMLETN